MRDDVGGYSCSHCGLAVLRTAAGRDPSGGASAD